MISVAAAIIRDGDRFLLTQRPAGSHFAGWWEFPGGKIEPGETAEDALARECREELGIEVRVGALFHSVSHRYDDRHVDLKFHEASLVAGRPSPLEVADVGWYRPAEMKELPILPADAPVVDALARLVSP